MVKILHSDVSIYFDPYQFPAKKTLYRLKLQWNMLQSSHFLESVVPKGVPTEELLIHCDYLKFKTSSFLYIFKSR